MNAVFSTKTYKKLIQYALGLNRYCFYYSASKRILELATPQAKNLGIMGESKADPYAVSQKALTYRATARIKKLAMPRVRQ